MKCTEITIKQAADMLSSADKILILCHMKPDGDTFGCGFAMQNALRQMGKTVRVECSDGFGPRYHFLYPEKFEESKQPQFEPEFVLAVDIADTQLLGSGTECWKDRVDLCIDHHTSNAHYASNLLLDTNAAATAEVLFDVLMELNVTIDRHIATCIYTGLTTDTGCFRYSNVTPKTHRLAALMMEAGADHYMVNKRMFETRSSARIELERLVMETLEYHYDKRFAILVISQENVQKTSVAEEDLEGISAIPRTIEGVEVSATLREKGERFYRISVRSNEKVNASKVCSLFGGGGHERAAGCMMRGSLEEIKAVLVDALKPWFLDES